MWTQGRHLNKNHVINIHVFVKLGKENNRCIVNEYSIADCLKIQKLTFFLKKIKVANLMR